MKERRDSTYFKWGVTALAVIFISILLVVIFTDLPGFFGVLTALETILEPLIFGVVIAFHVTFVLLSVALLLIYRLVGAGRIGTRALLLGSFTGSAAGIPSNLVQAGFGVAVSVFLTAALRRSGYVRGKFANL